MAVSLFGPRYILGFLLNRGQEEQLTAGIRGRASKEARYKIGRYKQTRQIPGRFIQASPELEACGHQNPNGTSYLLRNAW